MFNYHFLSGAEVRMGIIEVYGKNNNTDEPME
jgi:hypothetical protein